MDSREHVVIGVVTTVAVLVVLREEFPALVLGGVAAWGIFLSVFIDLDHFVIARLRTGDWSHLEAAVGSPREALTGDQSWIFGDLDTMAGERLVSHAVVGAVLVGFWVVVAPAVAILTGAVVTTHVCGDLVEDLLT